MTDKKTPASKKTTQKTVNKSEKQEIEQVRQCNDNCIRHGDCGCGK